MADSVVRAQAFPTAATVTDLFTAAANTTIGTIDACNHDDVTPDNIRISIALGGAANADEQYVIGGNSAGGLEVKTNDTFSQTKGWNLASGDVIRVWSENGTTSFNVSGVAW